MSDLPQPANVAYNGVQFSDPNLETLSLEGHPVYDSAQRTVIYVVWSITIKTVLSVDTLQIPEDQDQTTDSFFTICRKLLTTPGGEFHYEDNGFGSLRINIPNQKNVPGNDFDRGARDVVWGPKPRMLKWVPRGAGYSCDLIWTVDVAIPECDYAKFDGVNAWMEYCYRVTYAVDRSGYTTRTYSGHVSVPQTRLNVGFRRLQYTADQLREKINPSFVDGMRRIPGDFVLSEDKCRIDFTIKDEDMGQNAPPPGIIDAKLSHGVRTGESGYGGLCSGYVHATYEIADGLLGANFSYQDAANYFFQEVNSKRREAERIAFNPADIVAALNNNKNLENLIKAVGTKFSMITSVSMDRPEVYGKRMISFRADYIFLSTLDNLGAAGGVFKRVLNSDWDKWSPTVKQALSSRGWHGLHYNAAEDFIIDLCVIRSPKPQDEPQQQPGGGKAKPGPKSRIPPPQVSWLYYVCWLVFEEKFENVELKPLPKTPPKTSPQIKLALPTFIDAGQGNLGNPGSTSGGEQAGFTKLNQFRARVIDLIDEEPAGEPSVVQRRASASRYVRLVGYAARAGHTIPRPRLLTVGGVVAMPWGHRDEAGEGFSTALIGSYFGVPVYGAVWNLRYFLPKKPEGEVRFPANPFEGT